MEEMNCSDTLFLLPLLTKEGEDDLKETSHDDQADEH